MNTETRTCRTCGCQKPTNEFYDKINWCKQCQREYHRKWRIEHHEQELGRNRKWRKENSEYTFNHNYKYRAEHPGQIHEYNIKWYADHREQLKEKSRKWSAEHPEQRRLAVVKRHKEHPEQRQEYLRKHYQTQQYKTSNRNNQHNRRAKIKGQKVTLAEWTTIKQQQGFRCYWCKVKFKDEELTMDHVIPLNKGGLHEASNIVAACQPCNSSKGNRHWSLV